MLMALSQSTLSRFPAQCAACILIYSYHLLLSWNSGSIKKATDTREAIPHVRCRQASPNTPICELPVSNLCHNPIYFYFAPEKDTVKV